MCPSTPASVATYMQYMYVRTNVFYYTTYFSFVYLFVYLFTVFVCIALFSTFIRFYIVYDIRPHCILLFAHGKNASMVSPFSLFSPIFPFAHHRTLPVFDSRTHALTKYLDPLRSFGPLYSFPDICFFPCVSGGHGGRSGDGRGICLTRARRCAFCIL
jgi:hypothetical protein